MPCRRGKIKIRSLHRFNLTPKEAIEWQLKLSSKVSIVTFKRPIRYVAAIDLSSSKVDMYLYGALIIWDIVTKEVVSCYRASKLARFPYIPGLLSFRELPLALTLLRRAAQPIDCILCDGHGLAHPRRLGLASHLGLFVNVPTIGCAKSILVGVHKPLGELKGSIEYLEDKGEVIGAALRTRARVRPVYVSIGNGIDLESSIRVVNQCCTRYRLPEPLRLADIYSRSYRREREKK